MNTTNTTNTDTATSILDRTLDCIENEQGSTDDVQMAQTIAEIITLDVKKRDAVLLCILDGGLSREQLHIVAENTPKHEASILCKEAMERSMNHQGPMSGRTKQSIALIESIAEHAQGAAKAQPLTIIAYVLWIHHQNTKAKQLAEQALQYDPRCQLASITILAATMLA
jgi:hypothetical protein